MRTTALVALLFACVGAVQALAEDVREDDGKESVRRAVERRGKEETGASADSS